MASEQAMLSRLTTASGSLIQWTHRGSMIYWKNLVKLLALPYCPVITPEMLGVRLFPPRDTFEGLEPECILFGHGEGVFEDATAALDDALAGARKRYPKSLMKNLSTNLRLFAAAMKD
jgi:hypothetical protein